MPSDAATAALRDLEHHIALANQFVAGLDYEVSGTTHARFLP